MEWIFRTFGLSSIPTGSNHPKRFSSEVSPRLRFSLQRMMPNAESLATLADVKRGGCCGVSNDGSHSLVSRRGRAVHCIVGVLGKSSHTL